MIGHSLLNRLSSLTFYVCKCILLKKKGVKLEDELFRTRLLPLVRLKVFYRGIR